MWYIIIYKYSIYIIYSGQLCRIYNYCEIKLRRSGDKAIQFNANRRSADDGSDIGFPSAGDSII